MIFLFFLKNKEMYWENKEMHWGQGGMILGQKDVFRHKLSFSSNSCQFPGGTSDRNYSLPSAEKGNSISKTRKVANLNFKCLIVSFLSLLGQNLDSVSQT